MKGGAGFFLRSLLLTSPTLKSRRGDLLDHSPGRRLVAETEGLPVDLVKLGLEGVVLIAESSRHRPVLDGLEGRNLVLPLADQAERDGLDATRREAWANRLPKKRADLVAHQPIEDPARLLGLHLLHVEGLGALESLLHGSLRDLPEGDALESILLALKPELMSHVIGDRLPFAVGVRREDDALRALRLLLEPAEDLGLAANRDVLRLESGFHVHTQLFLRQVTHMAYRGRDLVVASKVAADRSRLCR